MTKKKSCKSSLKWAKIGKKSANVPKSRQASKVGKSWQNSGQEQSKEAKSDKSCQKAANSGGSRQKWPKEVRSGQKLVKITKLGKCAWYGRDECSSLPPAGYLPTGTTTPDYGTKIGSEHRSLVGRYRLAGGVHYSFGVFFSLIFFFFML